MAKDVWLAIRTWDKNTDSLGQLWGQLNNCDIIKLPRHYTRVVLATALFLKKK